MKIEKKSGFASPILRAWARKGAPKNAKKAMRFAPPIHEHERITIPMQDAKSHASPRFSAPSARKNKNNSALAHERAFFLKSTITGGSRRSHFLPSVHLNQAFFCGSEVTKENRILFGGVHLAAADDFSLSAPKQKTAASGCRSTVCGGFCFEIIRQVRIFRFPVRGISDRRGTQ